MRKTAFIVMFTLFWLVACGSAGNEPALAPVSSSAAAQSANGYAGAGTPATTDAKPDVQPTAAAPAISVEEAAQVRPNDHVQGAAEPLVTVIEYGDFQ